MWGHLAFRLGEPGEALSRSYDTARSLGQVKHRAIRSPDRRRYMAFSQPLALVLDLFLVLFLLAQQKPSNPAGTTSSYFFGICFK